MNTDLWWLHRLRRQTWRIENLWMLHNNLSDREERRYGINHLGIALGLNSLDAPHSEVSKCLPIVERWKIAMLSEAQEIGGEVDAMTARLLLDQFDAMEDRLQIWWLVKYVVCSGMNTTGGYEMLIVEGSPEIHHFIWELLLMDGDDHFHQVQAEQRRIASCPDNQFIAEDNEFHRVRAEQRRFASCPDSRFFAEVEEFNRVQAEQYSTVVFNQGR